MTPLRLAIAGAGLIGRAHYKRIAQNAQCELIAFADPSPAAAALASEARVPLYPSLTAMLDAEKPDGVILATPNTVHVSGALACIERGIPGLVEKPVAESFAAAMEIVRAQERTSVPVLVGHHRRHSAYIDHARALIAGGELGSIVAVNCTALFYKPDAYFAAGPWRTKLGGGPILINLIHEIDCMRALAGDIVEVQAFSSSAKRGFEVEDTAAIALRFANGALGTFIVSDTAAAPNSWEQTSGEDKAFARYENQSCYLIAGDRGSLSIPTMQRYAFGQERSWNVAMTPARDALPEVDPLTNQIAHFCAVIRGEETPKVSVQEGAKTLQVVEKIALAARTGERQSVPIWEENSSA
jgi:predicted dehydrogenase